MDNLAIQYISFQSYFCFRSLTVFHSPCFMHVQLGMDFEHDNVQAKEKGNAKHEVNECCQGGCNEYGGLRAGCSGKRRG